jgi:hypothetical protein
MASIPVYCEGLQPDLGCSPDTLPLLDGPEANVHAAQDYADEALKNDELVERGLSDAVHAKIGANGDMHQRLAGQAAPQLLILLTNVADSGKNAKGISLDPSNPERSCGQWESDRPAAVCFGQAARPAP